MTPHRTEAMQAMVLREPGELPEMAEVPVPVPGPGEVRVEVGACGFGLTVRDKFRRIDAGQLPRIPGHELVGRVTDGGAGTSLRPGQRVAAYYYRYCGRCRRCAEGRQSLCAHSAGRIGEHVDGGLAQVVVLPEANLVPVADEELSDVALTVACDALATPVHIINRSCLRSGDRILIVGAAGGVGIHLVQLACRHGAEVVAVDLGDEKLAALHDLGVETVDGANPRWATGFDDGMDVAVDFVGTDATLTAAYGTLQAGGTLFRMVSYRGVTLAGLSPSLGVGERSVTGSRYCGVDELATAIDLLSSGTIRPVVNEIRPLHDLEELCEQLDRGAVVGRAALIP